MENLSPAEKYYKRHLNDVLVYQKKNPEKMREKAKRFYDNLKINNHEKYLEKLNKNNERAKERYYKKKEEKERENNETKS